VLSAVAVALVLPAAVIDGTPGGPLVLSQGVTILLEPLVVALAVSPAQPIFLAPVYGAETVRWPRLSFDCLHVAVASLANVVRVTQALLVRGGVAPVHGALRLWAVCGA